MKRRLNATLLLAIIMMASSCNEQISPELLNSSSSTTVPGGGGGPTTPKFYFKLEQTSPDFLRYKMHKTGPGNNNVECKIEEPEFSTTKFSTFNSTFDITCFLEAEEQSLFYNGVDLKLSASPDLCETVVYAPYNFFQHQPGSSTRNVELYKCSGLTAIPAASLTGTSHVPLLGAGCDQAVQPVTPGAVIKTINQDQDFCEFNYTVSGGPNCDEGVISIQEYTYSLAPAYCEDVGGNALPAFSSQTTCTGAGHSWVTTKIASSAPRTRNYSCGGSIDNCRAGVGLKSVTSKFKGLISDVSIPSSGLEFVKDINLSAPNSSNYLTNLPIANYVRQCSGPVSNSLMANFGATPSSTAASIAARKTFIPTILDRYSVGRVYWNTGAAIDGVFSSTAAYTASLITPGPMSATSHNETLLTGWTKTYYAADSFMTTKSAVDAKGVSRASSNPFYAFYCLNNALDIKARIRLVVREWDQFPTYENQDFELLSDIFYQAPGGTPLLGRMDTGGIELADDNNPFNDFNDIVDWDDFLTGTKAMNDRCTAPSIGSWYGPDLFPGSSL
jgi:hypothetical protein